MWHWLGRVKEMGFSGVNNFPTHTIVDGHFRGVLEETGMGVHKEFEMVGLATKMDLFSIVYVATPEEAIEMAKNGADAIIAHVGTTVGGSIGVTNAVVSWDHTVKVTQDIIDAARSVKKRLHPHPRRPHQHAQRCGVHPQQDLSRRFRRASSLERMGVEDSLTSSDPRIQTHPYWALAPGFNPQKVASAPSNRILQKNYRRVWSGSRYLAVTTPAHVRRPL
jgi:predicted TIM-barrel enzyme